MRLKFAKMQGQGNDFVVVDGVRQAVSLTPGEVRRIADRHFGVGCDQLLVVERAASPENDFRYRIFNADGGEVEQCGNGARCFARFVLDQGLTAKREIRVETASGVIAPRIERHAMFPQRVNAAYMQVTSRDRVRLRVWERGAGETLACGTGACAAVVAGIRRGLLDREVHVATRGGELRVRWPADDANVMMTGDAVRVFDGEIAI